jgi:hypothetical protein
MVSLGTLVAFLLGAAHVVVALLALWSTRREPTLAVLDRAAWRIEFARMGLRLWWQRVRPW